jgi:MFS family permease
MLIIARILQGMSGSMTWAVGLALVIDSVESKNVGKAVGWTSTAMTGGILLGPLTGGVVYDRAGYYPVYAICFGLLAIDIVLRLVIIEVKDAKKWKARRLEAMTGQTLTEPASQENGRNFSTTATVASTTISNAEKGKDGSDAAAHPTGTFELTGPNGILGMLRKPRLLAALLGTFVESCIQTAFDATLPLVVESKFHWGSIGAGLIFLPIIVPTFIGPVVGGLSDRYGPRWFATAGFLFAAPFLVCLRFVSENTIEHKIMLCGLLAGAGLGFAMVFAPLMAEISWAVENEDLGKEGEPTASPYAQAYALYTMAFSGGAIAGPLMGGMIRDKAGFGTVGWSMAILTVATAVVQAIWTGGKQSPRVKRAATKESSAESAIGSQHEQGVQV